MIRPKVVVALYPFKAIEGGDLSLEKVSVLKRANYKLLSLLVLNTYIISRFRKMLLTSAYLIYNIQGAMLDGTSFHDGCALHRDFYKLNAF